MASCPQCSGDVELGAPHACTQVTVATRAPTAAVDPFLGRVLGGQYRLLEKIGEGGFGAVYLAEHVHLKKHFAAKVLRGDAARADDAIRRFEIEAIAASKLDHDNIIDVAHFGRADDGVAYLVMEHLRGETLAQRLARGALAFVDAVAVGAQICRALQAAHGAGVVHRDLKPGNVFLAERGGRVTVKLLDFGVCRMIDDDRADARMTRAGQLLGTPLYMAPEALREDGELDLRADVYALGVILYEMVTGAPPFVARDYLQVLRMHASTPPRPPSGARPDVPPQLERVILDALEKDPAARHQTAAHLEADLLAALPGDADSSLRLSAPSTRLEATVSSRLEPEPAAPTTRPPTNLLAPPTRFVGRPRELGEIVDLLRSARLVTLTGAGGAGKTRLAAEVGARVRDRCVLARGGGGGRRGRRARRRRVPRRARRPRRSVDRRRGHVRRDDALPAPRGDAPVRAQEARGSRRGRRAPRAASRRAARPRRRPACSPRRVARPRGWPRRRSTITRATIEAQLTEAERADADRRGRALPWDDVMSLALSIV